MCIIQIILFSLGAFAFDRCHSRGPSGYQQDSEVTCSVCTPATVRKSATYTHWGRSDCPANSRVVYTGFAAGSHHAQTGSGKSVT